MKIYRNFFIRDVDVSYYRGDLSFERWYENVVDSDDEITTSKPEDADLILTSDEVYKDTENAKEILDIIKDRPDTKLCVLCGTRYPSFDFAKRNCLNVLNRTDAILHNSVFREEDLKKINKAERLKTFCAADLNLFITSNAEPLSLMKRSRVVSCFGAVMRCKGIFGFAEIFKKYANNSYLYSSVGHLMPYGNPRDNVNVINEFSDNMRLDINKFNLIGGYDGRSEEFKNFLKHTRFAVFCHGTDKWSNPDAWKESPEYCVLEAIDAGVPIIVHEDWLNSITVFGEKPDIENSGILTYREWSDLGKENLMRWEKDYDEIVKKQKAFLAKWWGVSAIEKLLAIFREIVGEPELDPEMLLDGDEE